MTDFYKYSNGLTLIVKKTDSFSVCCSVTFGTGNVNETDENNGISHFIEHMNFKGTSKRSAYQISEEMERIGTYFNAYTSSSNTCYYFHSIVEYAEKSCEILFDSLTSSIYSSEEIEREKGVVIEEINMNEDTPDSVCTDLISEAYYGKNGYGRTILGPVKNVKAFTKKDIEDYLNGYYVAENTVICFVGNINLDIAKSYVKKYYLPFCITGKMREPVYRNVDNLCGKLAKNKDVLQTQFSVAFKSLSYLDDDKLVANMYSEVLGGGMSSRLFQKIREEEGLAYSIGSYVSRSYDSGVLYVYAGVSPENTLKAYEAVFDVMRDIEKNGITDAEFEKSKAQLKASYVFSEESSSSLVKLYAKHYLYTGKIFSFENVLSEIDSITKTKLLDYIKTIDLSKYATAVVGKKNKPLF